MNAYHIDFKRQGGGKLRAEIHVETQRRGKKYPDTKKLSVDCNFDCLPYILGDLKKKWEEERSIRMACIRQNDRALGVTDAA